MTSDPGEVVKVFSGTMVEAEVYQEVLVAAGIESKVLGTDLTAGLGSAIPGSVELWVHRADAEKAVAAIRQSDERLAKKPHAENHPKT